MNIDITCYGKISVALLACTKRNMHYARQNYHSDFLYSWTS